MAAAYSLCSSLFTRFGHSQTKFQVAETRRVNCEWLTYPVTSRTEKMHLMLKHSSARTSSCSFYAPRRQYFEPILCNSDASRTWRIASKALPEKKEQKWVQEGLITESLSNGMFRVRLDNEDLILGYVSGEIRRNSIRIVPGDKVEIEVSRYDSTKGRIIYRLKIEDSTKKKTKKKKKGRKTKVAANKTVRSGGFKTTNDY